jgi:hypothetical protein
MFILELLTTILGLFKTYLTGNKWRYAPLIGVVGQVFWLIVVVEAAQWGLLPGVIIYTFLYIRNFIKWSKDDDEMVTDLIKEVHELREQYHYSVMYKSHYYDEQNRMQKAYNDKTDKQKERLLKWYKARLIRQEELFKIKYNIQEDNDE